VYAINFMVKDPRLSVSAVDTCNSMAQSALPKQAAAPAPAARPTPAAPAAQASPVGVAPDDPRVDEALGALDAKMPSGCRQYANVWCRSTTFPDYGRLEVCSGLVANINQLVKQIRQSTSAVDTCNMMAKSAPPK
jgi:hypothetical protein